MRLPVLLLVLLSALHSGATPPDFRIHPVPDGKYSVFRKQFTQCINVFGIHLFGTAGTPADKLRHAAIIMAEYLDNNEDSKPDNPEVLKTMLKRNAFLLMTENESALERLDHEVFQDAGFHHGQGQTREAGGLMPP